MTGQAVHAFLLLWVSLLPSSRADAPRLPLQVYLPHADPKASECPQLSRSLVTISAATTDTNTDSTALTLEVDPHNTVTVEVMMATNSAYYPPGVNVSPP